MRDALRTCLQIAGGLTEATRRRAVGAARELLDQTGIDVDAVQRRIGASIPPEVQTLADELMAAGRANRDLLIGLIREEVDKAMDRVGRVADEVTKVGVVLEALERRVRNLEDEEEDGSADAGYEAVPVEAWAPPAERITVDRVDPDVPSGPAAAGQPEQPEQPARKAPSKAKKTAPAAKKAEPAKTAAPAKKTAAPAKQAPAAKKTTPAKKAPAAKKAAPAKKTAARKKTASDE